MSSRVAERAMFRRGFKMLNEKAFVSAAMNAHVRETQNRAGALHFVMPGQHASLQTAMH